MSTLVIAALAIGAAAGLLLIVEGLRGRRVLSRPARPRPRESHVGSASRLVAAAVVGVVTFAMTGWPVGAIAAAAATFTVPKLLGGKAARQRAIDRTEAIASWSEMIRDSIVAASGLEEAIVATSTVAPGPIRPEVTTLVRRLERERLPDALVAFGEQLDHPSGDLVVAALVIASRMEASDLSGLLTRLAEATRGEARMRIRVEVGRTRVRTATKIIVGVVTAAVAFLAVSNRSYLAVYDQGAGQAVLAVVLGIFAAGGWLLGRMAEIDLPERFRARSEPAVTGAAS
jgi:hypothetical protein